MSDCTFDVALGGGAGCLIRLRSGFATSVWAKLEGLNCTAFGSPLRTLSRLVLSASWLASGLPCRGKLFMAALSRANSMGVVGVRGSVDSLMRVGSEFLLSLSVGSVQQGRGEGEGSSSSLVVISDSLRTGKKTRSAWSGMWEIHEVYSVARMIG